MGETVLITGGSGFITEPRQLCCGAKTISRQAQTWRVDGIFLTFCVRSLLHRNAEYLYLTVVIVFGLCCCVLTMSPVGPALLPPDVLMKPAFHNAIGGLNMKAKLSFIAFSLLASAQFSLPAQAANTFSTLIFTPLTIEGLTGDNRGNLFVAGRNPGVGNPCPVWRINIASPSLVLVGNIPPRAAGQCSPSGLTFDRVGNLYVTETDQIYKLFPNSSSPPTATLFATGVPGTNGLAFDRSGNLWTGDGTQGIGRVWRITPAGVVAEKFRVQQINVLEHGPGRYVIRIQGHGCSLANFKIFNTEV